MTTTEQPEQPVGADANGRPIYTDPPHAVHDPIPLQVPAGHSGYAWNELQTMSETLAKSSLVPAAYRAKPANIVMIAIIGQELGWGLATAMRFVQVIDGKPTVSPEGMLALVRRAGHSVDGTSDNKGATVHGRRRDNGDEMTCTFTIDDAKTAKLSGKDNWQTYPAAMCWARALSMLCRRLFSDVLLGVAYVPEEMGATVNEHGEVIEATATETEPEPDYVKLGWRDAAHLDAARRASKHLLDQLTEDDKAKVRAASGKPPPLHQYTHTIWAARHKIVTEAARVVGLAEAFDDLPAELAEHDPTVNQDPEPPPVVGPIALEFDGEVTDTTAIDTTEGFHDDDGYG